MKKLLETIIKKIVQNRQKVSVSEEEREGIVNLKVKVDAEDMGKVIGRKGKVIAALRQLVKARAIKEGKRVNLELISD